MAAPIQALEMKLQPVSVTRQMAAAFPRLKALAAQKGLELHHLGAGYPHPEVSDPTGYIAHKDAYFHRLAKEAAPDATHAGLRDLLRGMYSYTDTLGPVRAREAFARVYGNDFGVKIDPSKLIPTVGSTGGISLMCSMFERLGKDIAYIVDAPTYTGFVTRAALYQRSHFYSVGMDEQGPDPEALRGQIRKAREAGHHVAFYYTVPDGHNPGGISFSEARRREIMRVVVEEGIFAVEDAPYTYISFESPNERPRPFVAIDPEHAVHLFTASKIGLPGPRVGFCYSEVRLAVSGNKTIDLTELFLTEASGDVLFHNPEALRGFEAYLTDENFEPRQTLWPVAAKKNAVYAENRKILLDGLREYLGEFSGEFDWTEPGAGFFSVFTFKNPKIKTDQQFVEKLIADYGVVTIPMFGFFPSDAKKRDPHVGLDQLRLSFSFCESCGDERREAMKKAVRAFSNAARIECGLPSLPGM